MVKKLQVAFLIIVPLIFLLVGLSFDRTKYSTDPESAYLLNGINIARGKSVGHFDNPGTTVQMYSALVISVTHLIRFTGKDLQTDVLQNSEFYIEVLRKGFIVINACILFLVGLVALSVLGNVWAGLLLQVAPFLSVTLLEESFTKVAPEQFLFTAIAVFIMLMLKYYRSTDSKKIKYSLLFGLLSGFGLATKLTFLPVLIVPFIFLKGQRSKWIYVASILPSFVLFTLPAATGYLHMANWFLNLGTHTGTYGQGNSGIVDPAVYFSSIVSIIVNNKAMIGVMVLASVVLLLAGFFWRHPKATASHKEFHFLMALLIAQLASIIMVAKHYHSNHYLFPALCLTGIILVFIFLLINKQFPGKRNKLIPLTLPVFVGLAIVFSLLNFPYMALAYEGYRASNQSTDDAVARLERDYKGFVKVYYYPVSFNLYSSLRWGSTYSRQYNVEKLIELYPDGLFYNAWEKSFQLWETNIPPGEFVKKYGGRILLVGGPRTTEELAMVEQGGLKLKLLFESRVQAVYEIDTAQSALFKGSVHAGLPKWTLRNDFETFSPDGQWIMSENGTKFCKNESLVSDKVRSGKHAFKLSDFDSYGMAYELQDVSPGDNYQISIWRSGSLENTYLVASAIDPGSYYDQSTASLETDSKGWGKVVLEVKIPESFKGNKLKVYLWNHSKNVVWYDDFEMTKY